MKRIISTFLIVSLLFCMVNIQASQNDYDLKETITVNNSELYIDDPTQAVAEEENGKDEMDFADDRVIVKVADDTTTMSADSSDDLFFGVEITGAEELSCIDGISMFSNLRMNTMSMFRATRSQSRDDVIEHKYLAEYLNEDGTITTEEISFFDIIE